MGVLLPFCVSTQRQSIEHSLFFSLPFAFLKHPPKMDHDSCILIMQLQKYRHCGVGSEGILSHYLFSVTENTLQNNSVNYYLTFLM